MKILTILGSPRRGGNTAAILRLFEQSAAAGGHQLRRINLADYDLNGCLGCNICQDVEGQPGCMQEDDIAGMIAEILSSDVVVYASPVYAWSLTAQMKALFDRHYCLVKWSGGSATRLLPGKQAMLLATCGDSVEENTDLLREMFKRQMEYLQWKILGQFFVGDCSTPAALGEKASITAQSMVQVLPGGG